MRRVRCDKTEPECLKCQKKGIRCSGQGIECRFSKHMKRKQAPGSSSKQLTDASTQASSSKPSKRFLFVNVENGQGETQSIAPTQIEVSSPAPSGSTMSLVLSPRRKGRELGTARPRYEERQGVIPLASPRGALEIASPGSRMLFDHCTYPPTWP